MKTTRLEAFSDGVIAIIITIMVLELRVPDGSDWESLQSLVPVFVTYGMSFTYLAIYWNNHHHMMHLCDKITGQILWANVHLLFWLSLIPFATGWMGYNLWSPNPSMLMERFSSWRALRISCSRWRLSIRRASTRD